MCLSSHSFKLLFNLFFDMRREIFRVNFFLNFCSIIFVWSHSKSAEWDSAFDWGSWRCSFDYFGHVLPNSLFNINNGFDAFCFIFEMCNKILYFEIMLMHLKQFQFLNHRKVELICTFVNHFVDWFLCLNQLLFYFSFIELELTLVKCFHLFF